MTCKPKRIRLNVDRSVFVIAERVLDRIKLTSYFNTRKRREHISVAFIAHECPTDPFDALRFIHVRCWGGAWPCPPSHRVAEAFRDCAIKLCIVTVE